MPFHGLSDSVMFYARKNHLELNELKSMLNKTESFLDQHNLSVNGDGGQSGAQADETTSKFIDIERGAIFW